MQRASDTIVNGRGTSNDQGTGSLQPRATTPKTQTMPFATFGRGTLSEPYIYWIVRTKRLRRERLSACNRIVKEEARKHGALVAVIRKGNHSSARHRAGEPTGEYVPADNHITLYLGRDIKDLQKQSHVYTVEDNGGNPIRVMKPSESNIVLPGKERVSAEYWDIREQPLTNINMTGIIRPGPGRRRRRRSRTTIAGVGGQESPFSRRRAL